MHRTNARVYFQFHRNHSWCTVLLPDVSTKAFVKLKSSHFKVRRPFLGDMPSGEDQGVTGDTS